MSNNLAIMVKVDGNGNLVTVINQSAQGVSRLGKEVDAASVKARTLGNESEKAFGKTRAGVESISKQLSSMQGLMGRAFDFAVFATGAYSLVKIADSFTAMQGQLSLVTASTAELVRVQEQLNTVAINTFANQQAVAKLYSTMQPALDQLGKTTAETVRFTELFNKSLSLTAPTTIQSEAAILQFAQAMGSGVLRGDEFNSMMENGRGVMQALADGMGKPIGELRALAEQGKLTSEVVYTAMTNAADKIETSFNKMPITVSKGLSTLETGFFNLVGAIDQTAGTTAALARSLNSFGQFLNDSSGLVNLYAQAVKEAEKSVSSLNPSLNDATSAGVNMHEVYKVLASNFYDFTLAIDAVILDLGLMYAVLNQEIKLGMWGDLKGVWGEYGKQLDDLHKKSETFKQSLDIKVASKITVDNLKSIDEELKAIFGDSVKAERQAIVFADTSADASKKAAKAAKAAQDATMARIESAEKARDAEIKAIESAQAVLKSYLDTDFDKQLDEINKLEKAWVTLYKNGLAGQQEFADALYNMDLKQFPENVKQVSTDVKQEMDLTAKAIENSFKRLDDAFANVWENIFNGAEDFGSSLKRWFTSLLAELAHAAITKPILISMSSAVGIGGSSSAMASGGGGDPFSMASNAYSLWDSFGSMSTGASGSGMMAGLQSAFYANGSLSASNAAISGAYNSGMYSQAAGTAVGTYLPYVANMYDGFQRNGVAGAAVSAGTTYGLIQLGSMFGPWGAAIGAILSMIGNGAIQTGIFGGARGERARDFNIDYNAGTANASLVQQTHYDAGWGRSGSWDVNQLLVGDAKASIDTVLSTMITDIKDNASKLGYAFNDAFNTHLQADVMGKTAEETQAIITSLMRDFAGQAVDSIAGLSEALAPLKQSSETSYETLLRLTSQFDAFNQPIGRLNDSLSTLSISTLSAVDSLVNMAGGMQNLASMQSSFINAFYTDAQKAELTTQTVTRLFDGLGLAIPPTSTALVELVQGLDLTTTAGQQAYIALTGASSSIAAYYSNLNKAQQDAQAVVDKAKQGVIDAVNAEKQAISARFDALRAQEQALSDARLSALSAQQTAANNTLSALKSLQSVIKNTLNAVLPKYDNTPTGLKSATSVIADYVARGIVPNQDDITQELDRVKSQDATYYASYEDFKRDQAYANAATAGLLSLVDQNTASTEATLTTINTSIESEKQALQASIFALDLEQKAQTAVLDNQLTSLGLINDSVLTVADAIASLASALSALAMAKQPTLPTQTSTSSIISSAYSDVLGRAADSTGAAYWAGQIASGAISENQLQGAIVNAAIENGELSKASYIDSVYASVLGRTSDVSGANYWANEIASGNIQASQLAESVKNAAIANGELPSFSVGANIIPQDMIAQVHKGEMIVPAKFNPATSGIRNGIDNNLVKELITEVRALRSENAQLQTRILSETRAQAKTMQKWDIDGMPAQAVAV